MKIYRVIKVLVMILVCIINTSCAQQDKNSKLLVLECIEKIKRGDMIALYDSFEESRKALVDTSEFRILFNKLYSVVLNSSYIDSNNVQFNVKTLLTKAGVQNVKTYTYPFVFKSITSKDSTVYIAISVSDYKLYNISFSEYSPGINFLEPTKVPHLNSVILDIEKVSWFRVWYESGRENNSFGDDFGYYAIEGSNKKLEKCNLKFPLEKLFILLNNVEFDSIDYKLMNSYTSGRAEHILIRLKFNNLPYSDLGEFEILYCLTEEKGVREQNFNYILLIHSKSTRYFINKNKYPELGNILTAIARKEYGECMEYRFH
jgi:hypothetical protein